MNTDTTTETAVPSGRGRGKPKKEWMEVFLEWLGKTGNVQLSAKKAKVPNRTVYNHREAQEGFRQQWDEAIEASIQVLEEEARRRAADGCRKPIFHKGEKCGEVIEYSDTLLIFLLKAHRPNRYRERQTIEHTGAGGGPLEVKVIGGSVSTEDL